MGLLIAGVLLWSGAHLFKRVLPKSRAKLGSAGRGIVAIALVFSLVLMFLGYRQAAGPVLWLTDPSLNMITNGLSLFAVYLMAASVGGTWITQKLPHPQLTAVKAWAIGHLLANGTLASLVLFGGLLVWATLSVIVINRQDGKPSSAVAVSPLKEVVTGVAAVLAFGGIAFIHIALGYPILV